MRRRRWHRDTRQLIPVGLHVCSGRFGPASTQLDSSLLIYSRVSVSRIQCYNRWLHPRGNTASVGIVWREGRDCGEVVRLDWRSKGGAEERGPKCQRGRGFKSNAWLKVPATGEGTFGTSTASLLPARDGEVLVSSRDWAQRSPRNTPVHLVITAEVIIALVAILKNSWIGGKDKKKGRNKSKKVWSLSTHERQL